MCCNIVIPYSIFTKINKYQAYTGKTKYKQRAYNTVQQKYYSKIYLHRIKVESIKQLSSVISNLKALNIKLRHKNRQRRPNPIVGVVGVRWAVDTYSISVKVREYTQRNGLQWAQLDERTATESYTFFNEYISGTRPHFGIGKNFFA
jgi:hypothetical protein